MRPLWYKKAPIGYWVYFNKTPREWRLSVPLGLPAFDDVMAVSELRRQQEEADHRSRAFA